MTTFGIVMADLKPAATTGIVSGGVVSSISLALAVGGHLLPLAGYVGHLLACAGAIIWALWQARPVRDDPAPRIEAPMTILGLIGLFVAGLPGVLAATYAAGWARRHEADGSDRLEWYRTLSGRFSQDPVDRLIAQLAASRLLQPDAAPPRSFRDVIEHGSRRDRQAVLGIIGLRYHPSYLPLLQLALASAEPTIRVQAAAVMTKLRAVNKMRMERALADVRGGASTASALEDLEACLTSGFLDAAERQRVLAGARAWLAVRQSDQALLGDALRLRLCRIFAEGDEPAAVVALFERRLADTRRVATIQATGTEPFRSANAQHLGRNIREARPTALAIEEAEIGARSLMALGRHRDAGRLLARHRARGTR